MNLQGIFPPIATPFTDDELDLEGLKANITRWMKTGLSGVLVLGSNGEGPMLDADEAYRAASAARECVPPGKTLIVGAGEESTHSTIAAVRRAAKAGADAVLVRTPSYFKAQLTTDVFVRHFTAVADASPVPVLPYNVPGLTGVKLAAEAVARLAHHPNIPGVKDSSADLVQIADLVAMTPARLQGAGRIRADTLREPVRGRVRRHGRRRVRDPRPARRAVRAGAPAEARGGPRAAAPHHAARQVGHVDVWRRRASRRRWSWRGTSAALPRRPLSPAGPAVVETLRAQFAALGVEV